MLYNPLYMAAIRTQVYLTADQRRRLDECRRKEGRPLAELIREALDSYLGDQHADPGAALDAAFGALPRLEVPGRDEWDRA
jgi:hypothetical protein